jgi:hypothetical protein
MEDLVFVSAHPDIPYFHWQTKLYIHNFIEKGIKPENIHVLFVIVNGNTQPTEESLSLKKHGINVHHYIDDRKNKRYIPSLRPLAMSRWLKENPHLSKLYFYHDSDIIFRVLPDFNKLSEDNICYLSDTIGYIGYDYIIGCCNRYEKQHKNLQQMELLNKMMSIVGIDEETVKSNQKNSGGAQYLLKDVDYTVWEKIYDDCSQLYFTMLDFDKQHKIPSGGIQMWTADMWALLWNLWVNNKETQITKELDFSWATDPIVVYDKKPILHIAGVTDNLKTTKFYKGEFINVDPIEKLKQNPNSFDYIERDSSTIKYIDNMRSYIQKNN